MVTAGQSAAPADGSNSDPSLASPAARPGLKPGGERPRTPCTGPGRRDPAAGEGFSPTPAPSIPFLPRTGARLSGREQGTVEGCWEQALETVAQTDGRRHPTAGRFPNHPSIHQRGQPEPDATGSLAQAPPPAAPRGGRPPGTAGGHSAQETGTRNPSLQCSRPRSTPTPQEGSTSRVPGPTQGDWASSRGRGHCPHFLEGTCSATGRGPRSP